MELVDENLGSGIDKKQAEIVIKVALLCTSASALLRPTMSEVVSMLEERMVIPELVPEQTTHIEDLRFKVMRDLRKERESQSLTVSQTENSTKLHMFTSSNASSHNIEIIPQSTSSLQSL